MSRELDKKKFQTVVVSPRSYFVFTPLLASAAVGTLEARTTLESVRGRGRGVEFFQGWADDVNFNEKTLYVEESTRRREPQTNKPSELSVTAFKDAKSAPAKKGEVFNLKYDKLVVAVGCYSQTFNTPGVRENAFFLKDVSDSIRIRKRILECKEISKHNFGIQLTDFAGFETASCPTTSDKLRKQLLNFAIVGGGRKSLVRQKEIFKANSSN